MRRVNIQAAFVGEPSAVSEGLDTVDSDEAVLIAVRGGELTVVVPATTSDEKVLDAATCIRGTLQLENERVLTFELQGDAVGAFFEHEPIALHWQREAETTSGDMFRAGANFPLASHPAATTTPISTIMATDLVTAGPKTTLQELADLLAFHRISGVPVVAGENELVGVVTESDLIARAGSTVGDLMTVKTISVDESATIAEVASICVERKIRRLPIVRDGKLVGLVSQADIVRWLARSS